jgi:hypothetical protein
MKLKGFGVLVGAVVIVILVDVLLGGTAQGRHGFGRPAAWLVTMAVFIALLAYVGNAVKQRADGIFIDDRNRISLARFQLVLWTVLLVSALMTAALSNAALGSPAPLSIMVPSQVWSLLGIGAFSFVVAPVVVDSRKKDVPPDAAVMKRVDDTVTREDGLDPAKPMRLGNNVPAKEDAQEARWMDIIRGDTTAGFSQIDISKVQQLAFTILLVTTYGGALYGVMAVDLVKFAAVPASAFIIDFPPVDEGFVALLGLSHAAYLAYKKTAT